MSFKHNFERYLSEKKKLEELEQKLVRDLQRKLHGKVNIEVDKNNLNSLSVTKGGVRYDYKIMHYDESEPASILIT